MARFVDNDTFKLIIDNSPLISIDLLVENREGEYLLGLRNNRPARGYWFVPGGRVLKNESLDEAFKRLTREELGIEFVRSQATFKGIYEHFYNDSIFGETGDTHYVVLCYLITLNVGNVHLCTQQHRHTRWVTADSIHTDHTDVVHRYTRDYFK